MVAEAAGSVQVSGSGKKHFNNLDSYSNQHQHQPPAGVPPRRQADHNNNNNSSVGMEFGQTAGDDHYHDIGSITTAGAIANNGSGGAVDYYHGAAVAAASTAARIIDGSATAASSGGLYGGGATTDLQRLDDYHIHNHNHNYHQTSHEKGLSGRKLSLVNVNGMRAYIGSQMKKKNMKNSAYLQDKMHGYKHHNNNNSSKLSIEQQQVATSSSLSSGFVNLQNYKKSSKHLTSCPTTGGVFGNSSQSNSHILPSVSPGILLQYQPRNTNQVNDQIMNKNTAAVHLSRKQFQSLSSLDAAASLTIRSQQALQGGPTEPPSSKHLYNEDKSSSFYVVNLDNSRVRSKRKRETHPATSLQDLQRQTIWTQQSNSYEDNIADEQQQQQQHSLMMDSSSCCFPLSKHNQYQSLLAPQTLSSNLSIQIAKKSKKKQQSQQQSLLSMGGKYQPVLQQMQRRNSNHNYEQERKKMKANHHNSQEVNRQAQVVANDDEDDASAVSKVLPQIIIDSTNLRRNPQLLKDTNPGYH